MCGHYLVEPVACTPASGWEKGQVENQVGLVRERFFSPRLRVKSYEELNAWLLDQCIAYAKAHRHPELRDRTVWEVFEAERPSLVAYAGRFDGFHAVPASVSRTCLVRFDNNRYSVAAQRRRPPGGDPCLRRSDRAAPGRQDRRRASPLVRPGPDGLRPLALRAGAGSQAGALRNGAPFKDWILPASLDRVRRKLAGADDGDRQMVTILTAVLSDGLSAVEAACAAALGENVHSADVILNILARRREPAVLRKVDSAGAGQPVAEHAGDQPGREHAVGDHALEFHLLGEGLVEMNEIGIARDDGVALDVLLGHGPLEACPLANRDLVERCDFR